MGEKSYNIIGEKNHKHYVEDNSICEKNQTT